MVGLPGYTRLLTVQEVALRLHVHPRTVRTYVLKGRLTCCIKTPGGHLRFPEAEIERIVSSLEGEKSE